MTNKEWMSTLTAEQFYDKMMWAVRDYGARFTDTRLAVIAWLDEPHEAEPIQIYTFNALNALDCVEERKKGEWDMFDLISSAWYGKGMYFKQDNDMVYSRHSNKHMTVDKAIREFISLINEDIAFVLWADGEAPTYVLQKKGKWKQGYCSECGYDWGKDAPIASVPKFCPNCGADMREES